MDKATFWATKSPLPEYHAIVFEHPAFDAPIRLVANQFADVVLGGQVHTAVAMTIQPPEQRGDSQPRLTISFPRQVVGRRFKQQLDRVSAYGAPASISVTYAVYLGDTDAPQITWSLYVSDGNGVTFTADSVQVRAADDNPMLRSAAQIYDPSVYTGLELM